MFQPKPQKSKHLKLGEVEIFQFIKAKYMTLTNFSYSNVVLLSSASASKFIHKLFLGMIFFLQHYVHMLMERKLPRTVREHAPPFIVLDSKLLTFYIKKQIELQVLYTCKWAWQAALVKMPAT
jgi:hypothetical protein